MSIVDDGTLRLEDTPEISPSLRARLQRYLETRSAIALDLDDADRCVLLLTRFGNTNQLHEVCTPLGMRRQLTFGADAIADAAYVPGHPDEILLRHDRGGDENHQLYLLDRRHGHEVQLTAEGARNPSFVVSPDGATLYFTSNVRNGRDFDLWSLDLAALRHSRAGEIPGPREPQRVREFSGDFAVIDIDPSGRALLLRETISISDIRIHHLDLARDELRRVVPRTGVVGRERDVDARATEAPDRREPSSDRTGAFIDRDRVALTSDLASDFVHLFSVASAGATAPLTHDIPWNVEDVLPVGRTVFFVVNEEGTSRLYRTDLSTGRRTAVPGLPAGVVLSLARGRGARSLALTVATPTSTGDVFLVDARTLRVTRMTESEMGGLHPSELVTPRLVRYPSFDGRLIPAFVYPARRREGPAPVLISIHGGPEAQAVPLFSPLVQFLASEEGVTVVTPNVRGSDGYGKAYLALDNGRLRENSVRDIQTLMDWIAREAASPSSPDFRFDASRVAVYGGSYGGYMVLAALVAESDRLVGGINVVGISNFVTFLENTSPYRVDLRRVEYGDERVPEMRQFLEAISPLRQAHRIRRPVFVAHGANDPRVPVSEAQQIVERVRENGHRAWFLLARDEGHGFAKKTNRDRFTELSVMFLRGLFEGPNEP